MKGRIPSKITLEKAREAHIGKPLTKSHKEKISKANKGIKRSKEWRLNQSNRMKGHKWSAKSRQKLSNSRKGYIWEEKSKDKLKKEIMQYDKNNKFIKIHKGITDAAKNLNGLRPNIWRCLNEQRKTAYGYIWKYAA